MAAISTSIIENPIIIKENELQLKEQFITQKVNEEDKSDICKNNPIQPEMKNDNNNKDNIQNQQQEINVTEKKQEIQNELIHLANPTNKIPESNIAVKADPAPQIPVQQRSVSNPTYYSRFGRVYQHHPERKIEVIYGADRNLKNELIFTVLFTDSDKPERVTNQDMKKHHQKDLIAFYEKFIHFEHKMDMPPYKLHPNGIEK